MSVAKEVKVPTGVMVQLYNSPVLPTELSVMLAVHGAQAALLMLNAASGVGHTVTTILRASLHPFWSATV